MVETSPALRSAQAERLTGHWFDRVEDIPDDAPLIVIANEFFDALPVRQFDAKGGERGIGAGFAPLTIAAPGSLAGEVNAPAIAIVSQLAARLAERGGALLAIDYGYWGTPALDSLQALRHHAVTDPFAHPGESDLTTQVDFTALGRAAAGLRIDAPVAQGVWLTRLGIEARAEQLRANAAPVDAAKIAAALVRLTAPTQMGTLFKVMAMTAPGWPQPAGFGA